MKILFFHILQILHFLMLPRIFGLCMVLMSRLKIIGSGYDVSKYCAIVMSAHYE